MKVHCPCWALLPLWYQFHYELVSFSSSLFHSNPQFQPLGELLLWPAGDKTSVLIMSASTSPWRDETKETACCQHGVCVCFRDNTLNYDWGLPLTQVPPALALHTHSCPGTYCPLRSAQTKCTNIKLFFALNHITVFTLQLLHQSQSKKNLTFVLKYVHYLPQCWIQTKDVLQSKVWRPFSDFWVKLALLIQPK